jgi:hypothetical protein
MKKALSLISHVRIPLNLLSVASNLFFFFFFFFFKIKMQYPGSSTGVNISDPQHCNIVLDSTIYKGYQYRYNIIFVV